MDNLIIISRRQLACLKRGESIKIRMGKMRALIGPKGKYMEKQKLIAERKRILDKIRELGPCRVFKGK